MTETSVPAAVSTESRDSQQAVYWDRSTPVGFPMKRIQTLGGLAVFDGARLLGGNAQQPRRLALLAVLARAGDRGVNRDRLATLLWGDLEPTAPAAISTRPSMPSARISAPKRPSWAPVTSGSIPKSDVVGFETASASGALEKAARLYGGALRP